MITTKDEVWRQKKLEYLKKYHARPEVKAKHKMRAKLWREANRDKVNAYKREWRKHHPEKRSHGYYPEHAKAFARNRRMRILNHYGGGTPRCKCCGETQIKFLALDHIDGGGTKHRTAIGRGNTYGWIVKNNYPPIFQILCHNCNLAKGFYGKCPHAGL